MTVETQVAQRTGTVPSGDVKLFYRVFGKPGATPILIFHGANYYDSADWIDVGGALASDRVRRRPPSSAPRIAPAPAASSLVSRARSSSESSSTRRRACASAFSG